MWQHGMFRLFFTKPECLLEKSRDFWKSWRNRFSRWYDLRKSSIGISLRIRWLSIQAVLRSISEIISQCSDDSSIHFAENPLYLRIPSSALRLIHSCAHTSIHSSAHPLSRSHAYPLIPLSTHQPIHSSAHTLIHSSAHTPVHSFAHTLFTQLIVAGRRKKVLLRIFSYSSMRGITTPLYGVFRLFTLCSNRTSNFHRCKTFHRMTNDPSSF